MCVHEFITQRPVENIAAPSKCYRIFLEADYVIGCETLAPSRPGRVWSAQFNPKPGLRLWAASVCEITRSSQQLVILLLYKPRGSAL